jgi:hypothetical protein
MNDILSDVLPEGYNKAVDLDRVGETNFLYGGLNIVYGIDGTGKSYQTSASFVDEDVVYFDTDGSNGRLFVEHCNKNGVHYINYETVATFTPKNKLLDNTFKIIGKIVAHNRAKSNDFRPVFIVDSLTSIAEGQEINNAEKISPLLYLLNNHASIHNYCLILIDHATEHFEKGKHIGFKLEGNAGAKKRTSVTVNRYVPADVHNPEFGGTFYCERARGNNSGLRKGDEYLVTKVNKAMALEWIKRRNPNWLVDGMTKSEMTIKTKNLKDKWVRAFIDDIFGKSVVDKITNFKIR